MTPDTRTTTPEQDGDPHDAARAMIDHLRAHTPQPHHERRPAARVIDVAGRHSGLPRPFGVNVTTLGGRRYLCSSTRDRDWVRNLLAAGSCRVERDAVDGTDRHYRPVMVEGREAAAVLAVYLPQAGYRDPQLPFAPDAGVAEIIPHTHVTAVLRLDPQDPPGGGC